MPEPCRNRPLTSALLSAALCIASVGIRADLDRGMLHLPLDAGFEDTSGHARHGVPVGAVRIVQAAGGGIARFDGRSRVVIPGLPVAHDRITVSVWARFVRPYHDATLVEFRSVSGTSPRLALEVLSNRLRLALRGTEGAETDASIPMNRIVPGNWTLLTGVLQRGELTLFVDADPVDRKRTRTALGRGTFTLTVGGANGTAPGFVGDLDELRVHSGEVDAAQLHEMGRPTHERIETCGQVHPCTGSSVAGVAIPTLLDPSYELTAISDGVVSDDIAQLAFSPDDPNRLYAVQATGSVVRYDFDAFSGQLSNALVVASGAGQWLGLAFHGADLYVSVDLGGSRSQRPGDGRIARFSSPDVDGVYQLRHDFVHSINKGAHDVNHLQIVGDTLYVGIGAVGRKGDPAEENLYTMTIARIVDLTQVDFSGPIDVDFKGPTNYLADETEWLNTAGADGQLRYYASGFRNPFGIAIDIDGDLWVATDGNSDPGYLSRDYLYGKVPLGGQAAFPPDTFGYGPPAIVGSPIGFLSDLGQNPSPTGLAFVPSGRDAGMVLLAQAGASDQGATPVGRDVLRVDPQAGAFEILVDDLDLPTDVVAGPFGRLLISDYGDDSIWLLAPPPVPLGSVPDGTAGGTPLGVGKAPGGEILLSWGNSCGTSGDYAVYEGSLGQFASHAPTLCSTGEQTAVTIPRARTSVYYLIVPVDGSTEGAYGFGESGALRAPASLPCFPQDPRSCD